MKKKNKKQERHWRKGEGGVVEKEIDYNLPGT